TRLVAERRTGVRINGHVDGDLAQELALVVEHLDAAVTAVRHVDAPVRVHRNAMRSVELSGAVPGLAPRLEPVAVFIDLSDARVDVAVTDIRIASRVPAMSVTCLNIPSTGGRGGFGWRSGSVPSSEASCLRPKTIATRP